MYAFDIAARACSRRTGQSTLDSAESEPDPKSESHPKSALEPKSEPDPKSEPGPKPAPEPEPNASALDIRFPECRGRTRLAHQSRHGKDRHNVGQHEHELTGHRRANHREGVLQIGSKAKQQCRKGCFDGVPLAENHRRERDIPHAGCHLLVKGNTRADREEGATKSGNRTRECDIPQSG